MLVDDCRGRATPTFKDKHVLTYNGWEREASALLRDIGEQITFTRALDLLGAIHLLNLERPAFFKSDSSGSNEDALACCTIELLRRTSRVGCAVVAMNAHNGTIAKSYRRELSRNSRLAAARMLNVGLGGAAMALAKREAKRAEEELSVRQSYWATVRALEQATT
jgi:hypothetical protein